MTDNGARLIEKVGIWIRTAQEGRYGLKWWPVPVDVRRSGLMIRLCMDRQPLVAPPPRYMCMPGYKLVERAEWHSVGRETHRLWNDRLAFTVSASYEVLAVHKGGDKLDLANGPWRFEAEYRRGGKVGWYIRPTHEVPS